MHVMCHSISFYSINNRKTQMTHVGSGVVKLQKQTIEKIRMIRENNIQVNPDNHRHINTTQTPTTTIMFNKHNTKTDTRTRNMAI